MADDTVTITAEAIKTPRFRTASAMKVTIAWTADSGAATITDTAFPASVMKDLYGRVCSMGLTIPSGVTAPTDDYDIFILDPYGNDVFGGALNDRDQVNPEQSVPIIAPNTYCPKNVPDQLTFRLSGNSVNSAAGTCVLLFELVDTVAPTSSIAGPVIIGNEKPQNGLTRAINTAMRLMLDVSDNFNLTVRFYNAANDDLIGTDVMDETSGTAEILWLGLSVDTGYSWYAKVDNGYSETTSDTYTFTTRATIFAFYSYEVGTARVFSLVWTLKVLGADYHTIQAWDDDRVDGVDMVTATSGEVLGVPAGFAHTETTTGYGLRIKPGTDSADYFAAIVGESPVAGNKPTLQITNNTSIASVLFSFYLFDHSKMIDVLPGLTSSHNMSGIASAVIHTNPGDNAQVIGCTNNDIIIPNIVSSPIYVTFIIHQGQSGLILCAYDKSKTINVGTGLFVPVFVGYANTAWLHNCVFNDAVAGIVNIGTFDVTVKNVCSQGSTGGSGNFVPSAGGVFIYTTCADEQGLSFDTDGFTLLFADNGGTDLSGTFTDDFYGALWEDFGWDRTANGVAALG